MRIKPRNIEEAVAVVVIAIGVTITAVCLGFGLPLIHSYVFGDKS